MELRIYAVYDVVAKQIVGPLMSFPNDGVARRTFQDAVMHEGSNLYAHPGDFVLLWLGTVDNESATLVPCGDSSPVGIRECQVITGDMIVELSRPRLVEGEANGS